MIFGKFNPEKISHENLTDLSTSPVRCSHFTLGNPKKSLTTVLVIYLEVVPVVIVVVVVVVI